jgi:hypothetical protein
MHVDNYAVLKAGGMSAESVYEIISNDAVRLGGRFSDMPGRAAVYHHLYLMSGGNFIFPLIAAHETLWARWYLFLAKLGANFLALFDVSCKMSRRDKMKTYHKYINTFKKNNRDVMTMSYRTFHFTRLYGGHEFVCATMPKRLVTSFLRCHQFSFNGQTMPLGEQRQFFEDFIRWQAGSITGLAFTNAYDEFDWPLARWFCTRPWVKFSYFGLGRSHKYKNYCDAEERTQKTLKSFDWAAKKPWALIEKNLTSNPFFPRKFTFDANTYFSDLGMAPISAP